MSRNIILVAGIMVAAALATAAIVIKGKATREAHDYVNAMWDEYKRREV